MPFILRSKKIIRVGIDAGDFVPFTTVRSGIQRIVDSFLKVIFRGDYPNFVFNYYFFGKKNDNKIKKNGVNFIRLPKRFFSSFFLPVFFKRDQNDIFLGFSGVIPIMMDFFSSKKIVFLYDLGFIKKPNNYSNADFLKKNLYHSLTKADKIITLSQCVKKEIENYFKLNTRKKIVFLYPGIDHLVYPKLSLNGRFLKYKYFLYVGVIKPGKNIERLFRVFFLYLKKSAKKNLFLVLLGSKEKKYFNQLIKNNYYQNIRRKIIFLENLDDKELTQLYLEAEAIMNLSYEEGFCFPVFEALSLRKKVIVNDLPIYYEFKKNFDNLLIGKDDNQIVKLMNIKNINIGKNIKLINTWESFVFDLLNIISHY